jgi:hypothetical protein
MFYGCFGWAKQNYSFVVSAFIGFSVFFSGDGYSVV